MGKWELQKTTVNTGMWYWIQTKFILTNNEYIIYISRINNVLFFYLMKI